MVPLNCLGRVSYQYSVVTIDQDIGRTV